jgi:hypothetical protein
VELELELFSTLLSPHPSPFVRLPEAASCDYGGRHDACCASCAAWACLAAPGPGLELELGPWTWLCSFARPSLRKPKFPFSLLLTTKATCAALSATVYSPFFRASSSQACPVLSCPARGILDCCGRCCLAPRVLLRPVCCTVACTFTAAPLHIRCGASLR